MEQNVDTDKNVPYPNAYFDGLDKIKLAAILLIIGTLLSLVALVEPLIALVAAIIIILAIYWKLLSGLKSLRETNPTNYGIGVTGIYLNLVAMVLLFIGGIIAIVGLVGASIAVAGLGVILVIIAFVIEFIGDIFIAIALFRVGSDAGNGLMEAGAILVIIISFIGWILVYVSIDEIKERARKRNVEVQGLKSSP